MLPEHWRVVLVTHHIKGHMVVTWDTHRPGDLRYFAMAGATVEVIADAIAFYLGFNASRRAKGGAH